MAVEDKYVRVNATDPEINEKISISVNNPDGTIYWHIGFNTSLDEASVNNETMYVIDSSGYVLETNIKYLPSGNLIQISPKEAYIQGEYYILCITKNVRSANMKKLEKRINILFKIKEDNDIKFKILPDNVTVPEPKRNARETKSRVYSFQKGNYQINADLKTADMKFNPLIGAVGLLLTIISLFLRNQFFTGISGTIAVFGIIHIVMQFIRPEMKSNIIYNLGVSNFKKGNIKKAEAMFKRAVEINSENELAEYALNKLSYYK